MDAFCHIIKIFFKRYYITWRKIDPIMNLHNVVWIRTGNRLLWVKEVSQWMLQRNLFPQNDKRGKKVEDKWYMGLENYLSPGFSMSCGPIKHKLKKGEGEWKWSWFNFGKHYYSFPFLERYKRHLHRKGSNKYCLRILFLSPLPCIYQY